MTLKRMTQYKTKRHYNKIRRGILMFYLLFGFPALLTYGVITLFTDLKGRLLLYSMLPVLAVLMIIFILYLVRPARFFRFWGVYDPNKASYKNEVQ